MDATQDVGESEWREFLARTRGANLFQSPEMARVFRDARGYRTHVATVESRGEIVGLLASVLVTYGGGARLRKYTTRSLVLGGPVGDASRFAELLASNDSFASRCALWCEIHNVEPPEDRTPFLKTGYSWEDHQDFVLDLGTGENGLWGAMSKSRRKGIGRAEKEGLELVELALDTLDQGYGLLRDTYSRAKVPLADSSLFANALRILAPSDHLWACGATYQDTLCAIRFVLRWNETMYDWYAGSSDLGREKHADEWLVWHLLQRGVSRGYQSFHFGGAGEPGQEYGPAEFKRRFGGRLVNPGRLYKIYHPVQFKLAKAAYHTWRGLG